MGNTSYREDWNAPVTIKNANCNHGGTCSPGKQNRVAVVSRSGKFVKLMPDKALYTLCNLAEHDGKLPSSTIKKVMARVWPSGKVITKNNVFHIKVKVMRCVNKFKTINGDYEEFKKLVNESDFLSGIDNEVSLDDDEAYELAQSLWAEVMSDVDKEEALFSFIDYLQLISARAKGFFHKFAYETSNNGQQKIVGVMWQTATMRRNFELFGDFIGLDMMKRGLNKLLWPYAGVAMYDEMRKLCIACEGVLCGERTDMYQFAATRLDFDSYERYKTARLRADKKLVAEETTDTSTGESIIHVRSAEHTDAAPRIIRLPAGRCNCVARLLEEDMCSHEIKAYGGFVESYFKPRHMARDKVTGSLEGWVEPAVQEIDRIIGYNEEIISPPTTIPSPPVAEYDVHDNDMILAGTVESGIVTQLNTAARPPIPFPEKGGKCKPLDSSSVKNILSTVSGAYSNLSEDVQFEISALAMKLQGLMTIDPKKSTTVTSVGGYSVTKPSTSLIASQSKKRLAPQHELHRKATSKKLNQSIQRMGIKQVVETASGVEIEANGKNKAGSCSMCKGPHKVTACTRRNELKMGAAEYILSMDEQHRFTEGRLRTYMNNSMPYALFASRRRTRGCILFSSR